MYFDMMCMYDSYYVGLMANLSTTKIVLLTVSLIYCVQSSHGQGLHFILGGIILPNNSHVIITSIGTDENALLCVTDNTNCCFRHPNRAGEWFYPNGNIIPNQATGHDFFRGRGPSVVRLNRRNNVMSPLGQYHCEIPDRNGINRKLFVNIIESRVLSVTINSSHSNPIEPGTTPTLTCTIQVNPLQYNATLVPLSVNWSGPVYGTGEFNTTGIQRVSDTTYMSVVILNSQGAYYDSGTYTCISDEISQAAAVIVSYEYPHRPNVYNKYSSQNLFHLSWTQHSADNVTSYQLTYSYQGPCTPGPTRRVTISEQEMRSYNITSLHEHSNYSYALRAVNSTGIGPPYEGTFTTLAIAPTSPPRYLTASPFSTNITIQWDRINCLDRNSEITRYTVRYGPSTTNNTERNTATVYGTSDNERVFTANRLELLTSYTFEVAGVNMNGQESPYTRSLSRSTTTPEVITIQLHLYQVSKCLEWTQRDTTFKLRDIVSSTVEAVKDICPRCNLTSGDLIEPFLMCFPQSVHQVTFRAQLKDRSQATAREIVTYIEEWITSSSNGARLTAHGVRLHINNTCVVLLSTIDDPECPHYMVPPTTEQPPTLGTKPTVIGNLESTTLMSEVTMTTKVTQLTQTADTRHTSAIVGGVASIVIVLIIALTVIIVVAIKLHCVHNRPGNTMTGHLKIREPIKLAELSNSREAESNQPVKNDETYQTVYDYCTHERGRVQKENFNITKCPVYGTENRARAPYSVNEGEIEGAVGANGPTGEI